uniref:Uncharacterized protein n=1 Tax=Solanum lycopersicum TaxID=4081 RepID=A0A3Q7HNX1_SOLLC
MVGTSLEMNFIHPLTSFELKYIHPLTLFELNYIQPRTKDITTKHDKPLVQCLLQKRFMMLTHPQHILALHIQQTQSSRKKGFGVSRRNNEPTVMINAGVWSDQNLKLLCV